MNANPMLPNIRRGRELYDTQIRLQIEPHHYREFLVLGTLTGAYAIDADGVIATKRTKQRFGTSDNLYPIRIGYRGVAYVGGGRFIG